MKLRNRLKIITMAFLIIPLLSIMITTVTFYLSWSLSWQDDNDLTVPRFMHKPLLKILQGEADALDEHSAGIVMVLDDEANIIWARHEVQYELDKHDWTGFDKIYKELMNRMPGIPVNFIVYSYHGKSGMVMFLETAFTGAKLFKLSNLLIVIIYYGMILIPLLFIIINIRPAINSFTVLENAANEIGRGNLDVSIKLTKQSGKKNPIFKELASLEKAFDGMRNELKENHERQSRMMLAISHDLKTPLTLIKGYVEALKDGMAETPEQVIEYADVIFDRSIILEERINDLIQFAKLRTSDWQAGFSLIAVNAFIEEITQVFSDDAFIRKRKFEKNITIDSGISINGDQKMLFQILENLFDNACRYTDDNDIIRFSVERNDNNLFLRFEDSGPGISAEHRDKIFGVFYRADQTRNSRGIGVGLSSVQLIVENHGGSIEYFQSDLGGAGFLVVLPICL